jgi:GH43 family beta-xylosidase
MRWMLLMMMGCGDKEGDSASMADANFSTEATTDGGSFFVTYTTDPTPIPSDDYFSVTLSAFEADGTTPLIGATAEVSAEMTAHGHGMNVTPEVTDSGDGTFTATPFLFHMTGHWTIWFSLTKDGVTEEGHFDVDCCE